MKLHLPKLLRVAVIAAVMSSATSFAAPLTKDNISYRQDDTTTPNVNEASSYLNVGTDNVTDTWQGNLVVGDLADVQGDVVNVGAFNNSWGFVTPNGGKTNTTITSGLKITGSLTLQGSGKIVLGGQYKGGNFLGLEATESITVTGGSLKSTKIVTKSLNVSGGTVSTSTDNCTSGNGYAGGPKQSYIKNSLTISGGSLSFGYTANVQGIGGGGHRMTAFGSSASFVMTQTGGTMRVYGDMDMRSGITIDQSAGTMVLRDTIYMGNSGTTTINQTGAATLVLGRLESTSSIYTPNFDINQSGAGLIHLAYGSNFATASTISLTQTGGGTINIGGGHDTSITGSLPSRGYALNSSPAEAINTFHNITQTDGSIYIKKNGIVNAGVVSIGDTVTVDDGGILGSTYGAGLEWNSQKVWMTREGVDAPVSVSTGGTLDMTTGSYYGISLTEEFQKAISETTTTRIQNENDKLSKKVEFDFNVIALNGADTTKLKNGFALFNMDKRLWSLKEAEWSHEGGKSYVDGTLIYDYWIDLTSGGEVTEVFSDTSSYLQTGLKISGSDIILNAANTHSYGTIIDGGTNGITVTLKNSRALGAGSVTTTGNTTLTTKWLDSENKEKVTTASLPGTITNNGTLTLDGSFSVVADTLKSQEVKDAFFNLGNQEAEDGFLRKGGYIYTLFDNVGDNSSLVLTTNVKISMLGGSVTLPAGTYTEDIEVSTVGEVDMTAYYMNSENHSISVSAIQQKSNSSTTKVLMAEGTGTLTVDSDIEVDADGGTIAVESGKKVSGSIENATVIGTTGDAISGIVTATLEGANTLTGNLTLGESDVLSGATVTTTGATSLSTDVASGKAVELGEVIKNTDDLTLSGSYDVRKLDAEAVTAGFVAANGDVTPDGNGFKRDDGCTVLVVNNENGGSLKEGDTLEMTIGTRNDGVLDKATGVVTFGAGVDYSTYRMVEAVEESAQAIIDASVGASGPQVEKVAMTAGTLKVDASIAVDAEDGTTLKMTGNDVTLTGEIDGASTSVQVTGSGIIEGDNSYSGGTVIDGGKLTVASDKALGTGDVVLKKHGTLDLSGKAVSNNINVEGCTLAGAGAYSGIMDVSGNLQLQDATTAAKVVMLGGGTISGAPLTTTALDVQTDGNATVGGDLTINDNGTITLNNGSLLEVTGTLTLGNGTKLVLNGDYAVGTSLLSSTGTLTMGDVSLVYGDSTVELEKQGNSLVLVSKFKQNKATATALTNWGIATASRAVVNAVRGQRSNTGCIANGKGTAWVASLGSKHKINGSDIDISGAAVGADMQVGRDSRIGIALGYAEGEVQPAGLRQVDQEGSYLVVYGEHGLKKLSTTSCLSMDWVAAYGVTDSEGAGQKWEQDSLQLNSRVNWNKKVNNRLCMSVFGGLEYFANNSDTVDGVKTGSIQNLRGEIGVGARYVAWGTPAVTDGKSGLVLAKGCEKLVLNGEVRYMNDMVRSNPVIRMNGLSGMGENPGRQGIGIEAGATYRIGERWSATANYGFNTMEDSKEHRLNIGAAYTF